jgi:uncharacterized protein YjiS (DUF1127 family)
MSTSLLTTFVQLAIEPIRAWRRSQVTYRELMALDDHQLSDIGLSRAEIQRVALVGREQPVRGFAVAGRAANVNRPHAA